MYDRYWFAYDVVTPSVPKWLSYFREFFGPKMFVWLYARLQIEAQSQILSHQTFYIKKPFATTTSGGVSK